MLAPKAGRCEAAVSSGRDVSFDKIGRSKKKKAAQ